jgi:hypothetical protein
VSSASGHSMCPQMRPAATAGLTGTGCPMYVNERVQLVSEYGPSSTAL